MRDLALSTLVNTAGRGIFLTLSALYFTRILGFTALQVGAGLSIAALFGFLGGIPMGHLADRRGAREMLVALLLVQAVLAGLLLVVQDYGQFVVVVSAVTFVGSGSNAVRNGLIAGLVQGTARSSTRASLRSVTNIGITIGTGLAALALHFDTRAAYMTVMYVDAASFAAAALLTLRVPHVPPAQAGSTTSMWLATRDLPFVAVTFATGLLSMHYWIIEMALPLWAVEHTTAPRWSVSVLMVLNTACIVLLQVGVATRVATLAAARRGVLASGFLFLAACVVLGWAHGPATWIAFAVLLVGAVLHVAGELLQAGAGFTIGFELAPEHAQGQYQGLYGTGWSLASLLAPTLMALLPLGMGAVGWWILGGTLLGAAVLLSLCVSWAQATRPRYALSRVEVRKAESAA